MPPVFISTEFFGAGRRMQPFPLPYEPTNLTPCFTLRARREDHSVEVTNARFTEHWQTDAPVPVRARHMDMNPTASRLYREDLRTTQPYVTQGGPHSGQQQQQDSISAQIAQVLREIQATPPSSPAFKQKQELYASLLETQRLSSVDAMAQNPYFANYDVAGDSRNVVRELRGAVSEDIADRGIRESKKLLERNFDNRWMPQGDAQEKGLNSLEAYDLMRPKFTDMSKRYN